MGPPMPIDLSGPADDSLLRDALRHLVERQGSYTLVVSDGISERIFYFAIGGIRVIGSGPRKSTSLAETLVEHQYLTAEQVQRVRASVGGDERRVGEATVRLGVLPTEKMHDAQAAQVLDELLGLFFWDGAELSFVEGQPPKGFYDGRFQTASATCDVGALVGQVLGRVEAWRETVSRIPNGREVFELTQKGEADRGGPNAALVELLDGTRTAAEAIERSGLRSIPAFEFLMFALKEGRVRRTVGGAAQRATREKLLRDVQVLEGAVRSSFDATFVRARLARTFEQLGETARAAHQWRDLGDFWRRQNDLDRALRYYSECVRIQPTDFATRDLVLEIFRHRREDAQVLSHGRPLADVLVRHNLFNRAKHLLIQLVALAPQDVALRRQLVTVLVGLGEREQALRQLRDLARILESRDAGAAELKDVYVRILALDPKDRLARQRFERITGLALHRRLLRVTAGATVGLLAVLGAFYAYEVSARSDLNDALAAAQEHAAARRFDEARAALRESAASYGLSLTNRSVQNLLAEIDRVEREADERERRRQELARLLGGDAQSRREKDEAAASTLATEARRLAHEGKLGDSHRVWKELLRQYPRSGAAAQARVPLAVRASPSDARILVNGTEVGRGSVTLEYEPGTKTVVAVEHEGYQAQRFEFDEVQAPEIRVTLSRPVVWRLAFDGALEAPPLVAGSAIYVAGRDRFLTSVCATDGTIRWRVPLGLYGDTAATPVLTERGVFVVTAAGEALCVDVVTGAVVWRRPFAADAERRVVCPDGKSVVAVTAAGAVTGLSAATGEKLWSTPDGEVATGSPVVLATGDVAWVDVRGALQSRRPSDGQPVAGIASTAILRGTPAQASEGRLWAFAEDDSLRLLAATTGSALRRFPAQRAFLDFVPAVDGDRAWIVGQDGSIAGFESGGGVLFRSRLDDVPSAAPAVAGERLYVPMRRGSVRVLDARSGEASWTIDVGSRIVAQPVVADGKVYVATTGGALVAFAE